MPDVHAIPLAIAWAAACYFVAASDIVDVPRFCIAGMCFCQAYREFRNGGWEQRSS